MPSFLGAPLYLPLIIPPPLLSPYSSSPGPSAPPAFIATNPSGQSTACSFMHYTIKCFEGAEQNNLVSFSNNE